jgi:5-methylcytosine-specific restriction endonuclease McrA
MPWPTDRESKRRSDATYNNGEYRRNKAIVRQRSGGRCEWEENGQRCGSRDRVQCDHIVPVSKGGSHAVYNLRDLCKPHHDRKTAQEGGGYRKPKASDPAPRPSTAW